MKQNIIILFLSLSFISLKAQENFNDKNWDETLNYIKKNITILDHTYTVEYGKESPSIVDKKYFVKDYFLINSNKDRELDEALIDQANLKELLNVTVNQQVMKLYFKSIAVGRLNEEPYADIMYLSLTKTSSYVTEKSTFTQDYKSEPVQNLYKAFLHLAFLNSKN